MPGTGVKFQGNCKQCGAFFEVLVMYPDRWRSVALLERIREDGKLAIEAFNLQHSKRCIARII